MRYFINKHQSNALPSKFWLAYPATEHQAFLRNATASPFFSTTRCPYRTRIASHSQRRLVVAQQEINVFALHRTPGDRLQWRLMIYLSIIAKSRLRFFEHAAEATYNSDNFSDYLKYPIYQLHIFFICFYFIK